MHKKQILNEYGLQARATLLPKWPLKTIELTGSGI